jgi:hypothetical protein
MVSSSGPTRRCSRSSVPAAALAGAAGWAAGAAVAAGWAAGAAGFVSAGLDSGGLLAGVAVWPQAARIADS